MSTPRAKAEQAELENTIRLAEECVRNDREKASREYFACKWLLELACDNAVFGSAIDEIDSLAAIRDYGETSVALEDIQKVIRALATSQPSKTAEPCKACGGTKLVMRVYGEEYDCELSTSAPCPDCVPAEGKPTSASTSKEPK